MTKEEIVAFYLPYSIKARKISNGEIVIVLGLNVDPNRIFGTFASVGSVHSFEFYSLSELELVLKPLKEFRNIPEILDEFSASSLEQFEEFVVNTSLRGLNYLQWVPFDIAKLCFKHHLDLFNLLGKYD